MPGSVRLVLWSLLLCALLLVSAGIATAQPAFLVKDINTSDNFYAPRLGPEFVQANGVMFFASDDGIHGRELWRSDGTEGGTFLLADICLGICAGDPAFLTVMGGNVYFIVSQELWRSDGSPAGTVPVPLNVGVSELAEING